MALPLTKHTHDIMSELRHATADAHNAAENTAVMQDLLQGRLSLVHYIGLLQRLHAFHKPLETILDQHLLSSHLNFSWIVRHKSIWLEHDIQYFNEKTVYPFSQDQIPTIETIPDVMGCLYVLEGSTLGALVIRKLLIKHYGYEFNSGGRYYAAYGNSTHEFWKQTSDLINTTVVSECDKKICINSAQETFLMFTKAMNSYES